MYILTQAWTWLTIGSHVTDMIVPRNLILRYNLNINLSHVRRYKSVTAHK